MWVESNIFLRSVTVKNYVTPVSGEKGHEAISVWGDSQDICLSMEWVYTLSANSELDLQIELWIRSFFFRSNTPVAYSQRFKKMHILALLSWNRCYLWKTTLDTKVNFITSDLKGKDRSSTYRTLTWMKFLYTTNSNLWYQDQYDIIKKLKILGPKLNRPYILEHYWYIINS